MMHRLGEKRKLLHTERGDPEPSLASGSGDSSLDTPPMKKTCTKHNIDSSKVSLKGRIKGLAQYFSSKILSMFSKNRDQSTPLCSTVSSVASNSPSSQTSASPTSRGMEQLTSTPYTSHSPFPFSASPSILSVKDHVPTHQPAKEFCSQRICKMTTCTGFKKTSVTPIVTQKTDTIIQTTSSHVTRLPFIYSSPARPCYPTLPRLSLPTETSTLPQASIDHDDLAISNDVSSRKPQTSTPHRSQPTSYWTQWLEDFKGNHKHFQADRQAMVEIAKTKLQLSQKQRIDLEDQRVARLRQGFSHIYLDSDEEEEEIKTTWTLTTEQMEKVAEAIGHGPKDECLSERYRIRISRGDLRTLTGLVWLNDEVINFYFNLISENSNKEAGLKVYTFNSFFYTKLSQSGYSGVRRWTKKVDLFDYDLILLPVHLGMHWCLATINLRTHQFQYYDSLLGTNPACLVRLREYLKNEFMDKKKSELNLAEWSDYCPRDIPFQTNSSDCGVFTCMYARHLAKQAPFNFCQDDMADIRNHMIYEILKQTLL